MQKNLLASIAFLGVTLTFSVSANTVQFSGPNPLDATAGPLTMSVVGNFTDVTDSGTFSIGWNENVLDFTSYDVLGITGTPWENDGTITTNTGTGSLTVIVADDQTTTGMFPVIDITFDVIGAPGTSTMLAFTDIGWGDPANPTVPLSVSYTDGEVNVIPVPPAVLLFGSGLLGLVAVSRRKNRLQI